MLENLRREGSRPPMKGVVAVVGGDRWDSTLESRIRDLLREGLGGVEIRADLFDDLEEAFLCIRRIRGILPILFTVRNSFEGGNFRGMDRDRIPMYLRAISEGADWVDSEWGTETTLELEQRGTPLLVSHHDFNGMMGPREMDRVVREMARLPCIAFKIVPTASEISDSIAILRLLSLRKVERPPAVAFAMGDPGLPSRILSISFGSLLTYGSIASPLAPGQISAAELLKYYRPQSLKPSTRILAAAATIGTPNPLPRILNPAFATSGIDAICIPFVVHRWEELEPTLEFLLSEGRTVEAVRIAGDLTTGELIDQALEGFKAFAGREGDREEFEANLRGASGPSDSQA